MLVVDPRKWHDAKEAARKDPYMGTILIDFSQMWADLIEKRMGTKKKLSEVAMDASHDVLRVQPIGFNGQMMRIVIEILAKHWAYGKELQQWHSSLRT